MIFTKKGFLGTKVIEQLYILSHLTKQTFDTRELENINRKIINRINTTKEKNVSYNLIIDSKEITEILTRNALGNADLRKISIEVKIKLSDPVNKNLIIKERNFKSQFIYKNKQNKFDLAQSIKIKKDVLIDKIVEDILIFFKF